MCGIAGFYLTPKDAESIRSSTLAKCLLSGINPRGGDATGAAWFDSADRLHHHTVTGPYKAFRRAYRRPAQDAHLALLHTRFATQGSEHRQVNNHPLASGDLVLVHNGHISNDDEVFAASHIARRGEVDSEAILAALRHGLKLGRSVTDSLEVPSGGMATAWLDRNDPHVLNLARGKSSPLAICQLAGGSIVFASTMAILKAALGNVIDTKADNLWWYEAPEGMYLRFDHGLLTDAQDFKPNDEFAWWKAYARTAGAVAVKYAGRTVSTYRETSEDWGDYLDRKYGLDPADEACRHCGGNETLDAHGMCTWCGDDQGDAPQNGWGWDADGNYFEVEQEDHPLRHVPITPTVMGPRLAIAAAPVPLF
jgi:asparagine synthetase B (glutamine-hydrolysing)